MNILFLSLSDYTAISFHGLYSDLLRQFMAHGDNVFLLSPVERKNFRREQLIQEAGATIVKLRIWNMQKTNVVEKAISMLTIDQIFIRAIKKYFSDVKFDLVLYPTPPITLLKVVEYVKKRDGARTYLLLKDIFPQNAVDLGIMKKKGPKSVVYRYFRNKEKKLYAVSDHIGCMSQANVGYVLDHNPEIDASKVEVCPNSTDPVDMSCTEDNRVEIRTKYGLPLDKKIFVYGGNLGKPQGIPFIIECLRSQRSNPDVCFLIIGAGTEYGKLEKYMETDKPQNVKLMQRLPKEDYDRMIGACDVGMIFLDHRFTIPNFPSRLLAYMQAKLPVLAATDPHTDIGKVIVDGGFGWWCESNSIDGFQNAMTSAQHADTDDMGNLAFMALQNQYSSAGSYNIIHSHFERTD